MLQGCMLRLLAMCLECNSRLVLLQALLENAGPSQAEQLLSGYEMLTSPEQMGQRFKFLTITSSPSHIPTPFAAGLEPFPTAPSHNST